MENAQVADIFDEIADLLELREGNEFRIRSYRNAARTIRDLSRRVEDLVEEDESLDELPNIGESTAEKIHEILETGTCQRLENLRDKVPGGVTELMRIPQLGPRKAKQIHDELDVESLDDLKEACENEQVRDLEGMGRKTEQNILEGIETLDSTSGRISLKEAADNVESLRRHLETLDAVKRWEVAGSYRRRKETIGDLDILVEATDRKKATGQLLDYDAIDQVDSRGQQRVTVRLDSGLQIDFRYFEAEAFGAAMLYFTGSKAHNIAVRQRAVDRDWKLNEYGLFNDDDERLAGKTEASVYHRLNLAWVPPELREDRGEVDAAADDDIPDLIELDDIQGDLHCHTDKTDGSGSIEDMVDAARSRGYSYLAITEHSKAVTVANGLNDDELNKHAAKIREIDDGLSGFRLLAGIEVDILKSGKLDLKQKTLADLDWVVASIHSHFDLPESDMTDRLLKAIESGVVHAIGHPLGRMIGSRDAITIDFDRVAEACAEHDVYLEVNAQPHRLDLPDTFCQRAREAGVKFVIDTDAHKRDDLQFMELGVATARRGWLTADDVLNTRKAGDLRRRINRSG